MSTGKLEIHRFQSEALEGNPLGDPTERDVYIYTPPGYTPDIRIPALLAVVGFTGTGGMLFGAETFGEDLKSRMDRLINSGKCPPVMIVAPDCFNRVGGSQYINSSAIGNYEDYLMKEIVPFAEGKYSVGNWGVFGKSSGGYGAMVLGMRHPEVFQALANHSGDANFELCYLPEVPAALDGFQEAGGPAQWLEKFWADENQRRSKYMKPLMTLAMAAHYSPNPESPHMGVDFPFDLETGIFREDVWKRWQEWDPVRMIARHEVNLKKLKLVYVDCGSRDEFSLHWGSRAIRSELSKIGVDCHYEEFPDGHRSISYRYDVSVPLLAKALQ